MWTVTSVRARANKRGGGVWVLREVVRIAEEPVAEGSKRKNASELGTSKNKS